MAVDPGKVLFDHIAASPFEPPKNSENNGITKAEDFDGNATQLMMTMVSSVPVKDLYGHLKTRPDKQNHVKSTKEDHKNSVNL